MSIAEKALEALRRTSHKDPRKDFKASFEEATEEVNTKYIYGTIPYARENHPDLWRQIIEAEDRISDAWLAGVEEGLKKNLDEWVDLNLKAIRIFEGRKAQGTLL